MVAGALATLACGAYAGGNAFVSAVQHPSLLDMPEDAAAAFFSAMSRRAAGMQLILALSTVVGCFTHAWIMPSRGQVVSNIVW